MTAYWLAKERLERLLLPHTLTFLGLLAFALFLLSIAVRARATYRYDLAATLYLQRLETPFLTRGAHAFTFLGNSSTLAILALIGFIIASALRLTEV